MVPRRRALAAIAGLATLSGCNALADDDETETPTAEPEATSEPDTTPEPETTPDWVDADGSVDHERLDEVHVSGIEGRSARIAVTVTGPDGREIDTETVYGIDAEYHTDAVTFGWTFDDDEQPRIRYEETTVGGSRRSRAYQFPYGLAVEEDEFRFTNGQSLQRNLDRERTWFRRMLLNPSWEYEGETRQDGEPAHLIVGEDVEGIVDEDGVVRRLAGTMLADGQPGATPDPDGDDTVRVDFEWSATLDVGDPPVPDWVENVPRFTFGETSENVFELTHRGGPTIAAGTPVEITSHDDNGRTVDWEREFETSFDPSETRSIVFVSTDEFVEPRIVEDDPPEAVQPNTPPFVRIETETYSVVVSAN